MGITDYLNKTKKSGLRQRDNIELLRPIVNIFVGEFGDDEKQILMDTLSARVGSSKKIHYCEIKLKGSRAAVNGGVYLFPCSGVARVKQYDIGNWNTLLEQAKKSGQIKKDAMDLAAFVYNEASSEVKFDSQGRIRLNYIIQADCVGAALLEKLVDVFSASFGEYYANGVDTGLYCLLDQQGYENKDFGEERKSLNFRTLTVIDRIVEEKKLDPAYILSNYTSKGILERESLKDRVETIALHMILKDGKSVEDGRDDRQRQFSEKNFVDAAKAQKGHFCTIGKINLKVDEELRDWVVYKTVFADLAHSENSVSKVKELIGRMRVDEEDYETRVRKLFSAGGLGEGMFYPMVMNRQVTPAECYSKSNEFIAEKLYGQGLAYFCQENFQCSREEKEELVDELVKGINDTLDKAYRDKECSLAEVYQVIKHVEQQFEGYMKEYGKLCSDRSLGVESWKKEACSLVNHARGADDVLRAGHTLAYQYLDKYLNVKQAEAYMEVAESCLKEIKISAGYYREQSHAVEEARQELEREITERERHAEKLLCGNMDKYYTKVTMEWMENSVEYGTFFREINNRICSRELTGERIYQEVIQFCDEMILPDSRYPDDIAIEMLRRLKNFENLFTEEAIYSLAFETIMKGRKCFVSHAEFGQAYKAVCFLVNPDNDLVNSANEQMNRLLRQQQMQWFFEEYYNGMDILFLEGCFDVNDIYQYDLYKRVDEQFEKK